jgi:hypothetical protein
VIFRVKALEGLEDTLAASIVALWDQPAADLNESVIPLVVNASQSGSTTTTVRI